MTPQIIEAYRKDIKYKPGHGYGRNIGTAKVPVWFATRNGPMSAEIIHSTNNRRPTAIEQEARFLRDSPDVSCHDLIAKNGDVYIILPEDFVAWHSGNTRPGFINDDSFGTELHISIGEQPTAAQLASLDYRIRERRKKYGIPLNRIDTHRAVAVPKGRKPDPEGWSDTEFYAWRDGLEKVMPTDPMDKYRVAWGADYADLFRPDFGIVQRYMREMDRGNDLGACDGDETTVGTFQVQPFGRGAILYRNGQTEVVKL